jgi:hypothetical protein
MVHRRTYAVGLEKNPDEGENSPKLKTSVGWRVQQWGVVLDGVVKERKERKRWERQSSEKGGKGSREWGRKTPASV